MTQALSLDATLDRSDVSDKPVTVKIEATGPDRETTAARFDLLEVGSLSASLSVRYLAAEKGILVEGTLTADIVQRCILTLDPVPDHISESFELLLVDEETAEAWDEQERYLEPDQRDYDALVGDTVPLGEIVAQTLSILMNEFPRAEGAELSAGGADVEIGGPERENPFAALEGLKKKS